MSFSNGVSSGLEGAVFSVLNPYVSVTFLLSSLSLSKKNAFQRIRFNRLSTLLIKLLR